MKYVKRHRIQSDSQQHGTRNTHPNSKWSVRILYIHYFHQLLPSKWPGYKTTHFFFSYFIGFNEKPSHMDFLELILSTSFTVPWNNSWAITPSTQETEASMVSWRYASVISWLGNVGWSQMLYGSVTMHWSPNRYITANLTPPTFVFNRHLNIYVSVLVRWIVAQYSFS